MKLNLKMINFMEKEFFIETMVIFIKGDFINDKAKGKGIYYFKDGDIYEVDFKIDELNDKW